MTLIILIHTFSDSTSSVSKSTDSCDSKQSESQQPVIKFEWTQMRPRAWHHLDELFAGQCDGMTYEEIEVLIPSLTMLYYLPYNNASFKIMHFNYYLSSIHVSMEVITNLSYFWRFILFQSC